MLRRSDLTKQFEAVIQQEIKNYNDSLSLIYQKLNELTQKINDFNDLSLENHAIIHSQHVDLVIDIENIKNFQNSISKTCFDKFEKNRLSHQESNEKILQISDIVSDKLSRYAHMQIKISALQEEVEDLKTQLKINNKINKDNIEDAERRLKSNIQQLKKEILELPSDSEEIKNKLTEKISLYMMDVEKVMKEINVSKKESSIMQNKIENIYMIISRFQEKQ